MVNGRDHNPFGFSIWLAGGGIKGGMTYGATDDFGFKAVENPVHIHDLHATILYLMGIDHEKLTYNYSGRDFRLTDAQLFLDEVRLLEPEIVVFQGTTYGTSRFNEVRDFVKCAAGEYHVLEHPSRRRGRRPKDITLPRQSVCGLAR